MTYDLARWLLEKIADDEHRATVVLANLLPGSSDVLNFDYYEYRDDATVNHHVPVYRPREVLADCDARRRIVAYLQRETVVHPIAEGDLLRLLALSYADRPGYREEWRP